MKEYRIVWCRYPFAYNNPHVMFIQAPDVAAARKIAANRIEREHGVPRQDFGMSGDWPASHLGEVQEAE